MLLEQFKCSHNIFTISCNNKSWYCLQHVCLWPHMCQKNQKVFLETSLVMWTTT